LRGEADLAGTDPGRTAEGDEEANSATAIKGGNQRRLGGLATLPRFFTERRKHTLNSRRDVQYAVLGSGSFKEF